MKTTHSEIFLFPAGSFVGAGETDFYVLYAPFSQDICYMEEGDALKLYNYWEHHTTIHDKYLKEFADDIFNANQTPPIVVPQAKLATRMSLMPNYICNFSCTYCYSAKGRSKKTISWAKAKTALDYFIDNRRIKSSQPLSLFISGGGEPLVSWDIVSQTIDYAQERANQQGLMINISLITNGSLLSEEKAEWLKSRNCTVCVSFEVLEELQNSQRGQYDKVKQALQILGSKGVTTMINATITPASVKRMREMTEEVVINYPFVKQFTMEPVTSTELFSSPSEMRQFYETFIKEYKEAKQLAKKQRIHLRFEMDEALDSIAVRHCPGKFCLTAEGTISACHLATSPQEARYEKCIYGRVDNYGNVIIDEEKFQQLYNDNMLTKNRCNDCFARWNCGGECMARNDTYSEEFINEVCHFNKKWLTNLIREKLETETMEEHGLSLREVALKTEIDILREKEIYVIPADQEQWILYAPLADSAALLSFNDIRRLGKAATIANIHANKYNADEEALELLNDLTNVTPVSERDGYVRSIADFRNLSILPNNVCNFSCSYCYSAKGRSKQRLSYGKAQATVDYFLSPERCQNELLTISIFGGGEPLLSWSDVVKPLLSYIQTRANDLQQKIIITLITNGSLIPEDFISICKSNNIDLVISYEVLREIQDSQRRHYDLVTNNIRKLIEGGVIPAINTVITPINVKKIEDTVEQLHAQFPEIKHLAVEPVKDIQFPDRHEFYRQFISHFMQAHKIAELYDISLTCSLSRKVDQTIERYCAGEMALCADSSLSICPCVSSPMEPHYNSYVYGQVKEDGSVVVDERKLKDLLTVNINSYPWCEHCYARWNCAGGCMHSNNKNGGKQDKEFCWFTREMTRIILLERLKNEQTE